MGQARSPRCSPGPSNWRCRSSASAFSAPDFTSAQRRVRAMPTAPGPSGSTRPQARSTYRCPRPPDMRRGAVLSAIAGTWAPVGPGRHAGGGRDVDQGRVDAGRRGRDARVRHRACPRRKSAAPPRRLARNCRPGATARLARSSTSSSMRAMKMRLAPPPVPGAWPNASWRDCARCRRARGHRHRAG